MSSKDELIEKFGPKIDHEELITKCEQIVKIFAISIEDLYINWESFVITKYDGLKLEYTVENLGLLQNYIQSNLEKRKNGAPSTTKLNKKINITNNNSSPFNFLPSTPTILKKKQKLNDSTPRKLVSPLEQKTPITNTPVVNTPTPLKTTQESGKIIESLNNQITISPGFKPDLSDENPIKLIANFDPKKYQFRTMRTKILETADILDEQIDSFTKIIQQHYQIPSSDFNNPSIISQSEIITVGRIIPDNPQVESIQLNSSSLALETSRTLGIGKRIPLDLSNLTDYSLFPGQIVALRGKNASGDFFKINEILEIPYLGSPVSTNDELTTYYENLENDLKILCINGPYTSSKDLDFTYLENFVTKVNNEIQPHVVIMFGPFIDISHPLVSSGNLDIESPTGKKIQTLDDIFKFLVSPILKKINNKIQIILIPSLKDSISKHAAYPQDSYDKKQLQLSSTKNIKNFPNPSIFQINEILIGVSNNDIFKDLKDINKGSPAGENRFDRISNHIIQQRRFYPSFPGSKSQRKITSSNDDEDEFEFLPSSELDVPYLGLSEFNDVLPDILIIPSELRFFARVVKNTLVINPGVFMRPNSSGTLAQITIEKPKIDELTKINEDGEDLYLHDIWKRARVDIIKS
ncbi:hypothetical protein BN7_4376 [Wickerhamomyces ciferrii]|uniref:DNA polymerase alpha subunit B n=1 Tax=Wickerhamomyces ciferrii (strain ATCC 14091 / BCRC 22168 / CBS 111 / JCM 3599 / NBRC 0793 / NRRL Y-1031 F-60-10) TaxID=1206466 RepID=K0KS48_WICCF|nr:uncharacterized protein BN7_4376 [Wickerhamomyces ciferrii]CCH44807.1 hypothetical protein BN7_4376 [Wickerhamomyces ciferrii]